jgi:uncharacterized protein DUF1326
MRMLVSLVAAAWFAAGSNAVAQQATIDWSMNATIIEACSCPMFCQCYFNPKPAGQSGAHGGAATEHFCKFNNAFRVNTGHYGATKLDGAKFWVAGDLGDDFSDGEMKWGVLTFDPSVTKEQRAGVQAVLGGLYPVKWTKFSVAPDGKMDWTFDKDKAHALLNGGKTAEVALTRFPGNTNDPIVIQNLKYWGAPRNDGFVLMPNTVEGWHEGTDPFEFKGTNGFMITFDIASKDVGPAKAVK